MRYYIETYGCAANQFDSLLIAQALDENGWTESDLNSADLVILNTCGVKKPTEDKILFRLNELNRMGKNVMVAGCLTRIDPEALQKIGFSVAIDVRSVNRAAEAAARALRGARNEFVLSENQLDKPLLLKRKLTETIGVIEVQEGCAYSCTYCATKLSRDGLYSFPDSSIVRAASELARQGAREIWLTGQDVAAYRYENRDLVDLLYELDTIPADFYVRVGMSTPPFFRRIAQRLLSSYPKKAYQFFHLPVQSGSDRVLMDMKRGYRADLFRELVRMIRSYMPMASVETDVIVGYPTEEEEDFEMTLRLIEETRPNVVNISKYWKRPGTEAAKLKDLDTRIVARRSRAIYELVMRIMREENEKWVGWEGEAVITERGEKEGFKGRNFAYKQIVIKSSENVLGRKVRVVVTDADAINLYARVVEVLDEKEALEGSRGLRSAVL
ncbi:MAG: tRNA (N(6)-L-threonylcarbamoyladenosine(37)-C(2))-methylthiotransferase [Nitrososphaeria archaeon]